MESRTPLQVIAIRDSSNADTDVYIDMLRLALEGHAGHGVSDSYLADSVDLSIRVLTFDFPPSRQEDVQRLLAGAVVTILVIIENSVHSRELQRYRTVLADPEIEKLKDTVEESAAYEVSPIIEFTLPDPTADSETQLAEGDPDGIEPGLQSIALPLTVLSLARRLLHRHLNQHEKDLNPVKLFISHAKIDGIPMALSLLGLMRRLRRFAGGSDRVGLDTFYDVEDIKPGDEWRKVLENNVSNSVLVALRTNEYEKRYWCRNEYLWAESSRMPILVVDLRADQHDDSSRLPFDSAPVVKVHDGNLVRVILHALAYDLRMLRHRVQLGSDDKLFVLPHKPSTYSLSAAMKAGAKRPDHEEPIRIVYPNPALPDDYQDSIRSLANGSKAVEVMSMDQYLGAR